MTLLVVCFLLLTSWWFHPRWKNKSQNGNLPQMGPTIKWNHHPVILDHLFIPKNHKISHHCPVPYHLQMLCFADPRTALPTSSRTVPGHRWDQSSPARFLGKLLFYSIHGNGSLLKFTWLGRGTCFVVTNQWSWPPFLRITCSHPGFLYKTHVPTPPQSKYKPLQNTSAKKKTSQIRRWEHELRRGLCDGNGTCKLQARFSKDICRRKEWRINSWWVYSDLDDFAPNRSQTLEKGIIIFKKSSSLQS